MYYGPNNTVGRTPVLNPSVNDTGDNFLISFLCNETFLHPARVPSVLSFCPVAPATGCSPSTPSTTTTTRQRRAGRLITSRVTATILLLLLEGPLTAHEIVEYVNWFLGENHSYNTVKQYLYYYRKKGILVYNGGLWSLTKKGKEFVNRIERWLRKLVGDKTDDPPHIYSNQSSNYRESSSRYNLSISKVKVEYKTSNSINYNYSDLLNRLREEYGLDNDEVDALRTLLEHYARTSSTYMYIEDLARRMGTTPSWLYKNVLRRLISMKLVYFIRHDGKVGLGRNLRRLLGLGK